MLNVASTPTILKSMLRNLNSAYAEREDPDRALLAQERLLVLATDDAQEHRDHGVLLDRAMEPAAAVAAFQRYLQLSPDASDAREVRANLTRLRKSLTV